MLSQGKRISQEHAPHALLTGAAHVPSISFTPPLCLVLFVLSLKESKILRSGMISSPTLLKHYLNVLCHTNGLTGKPVLSVYNDS